MSEWLTVWPANLVRRRSRSLLYPPSRAGVLRSLVYPQQNPEIPWQDLLDLPRWQEALLNVVSLDEQDSRPLKVLESALTALSADLTPKVDDSEDDSSLSDPSEESDAHEDEDLDLDWEDEEDEEIGDEGGLVRQRGAQRRSPDVTGALFLSLRLIEIGVDRLDDL